MDVNVEDNIGEADVERYQAALDVIARWMGPLLGCDGPAPTGREAAYRGAGPMLNVAWEWPGRPTPTILLEGGPYDWAIDASFDEQVIAEMRGLGLWCEPYAGYALCLYRLHP